MNRISVITICFNNPDELKQTCASVDNQLQLPFEHLIIDGSSKPDIKTFLETNPQPTYRRWICERDNGIADAFNKGIRHAKGDILYLLNSGDTFYNEHALEIVTDAFSKNPGAMWCHGKLHTLRGNIWVFVGKPFEKSKLYRGMRGVAHPTMYIRREVYDRHGLYDTNVKIAMDYDFLCRIADEPFIFIDQPLATFDPTGVSSTRYIDAMKESYARYRKHYGWSFKQKLWGWRLTLLHYLLNSPIGKTLYKLKVKLGLANW
ncbi:glycosyltransferase family 2 protein [Chitinophagaceae bacterium MMS25-I14]